MSTEATAAGASATLNATNASPNDKGKGKGKFVKQEVMDDDEDEEDDEEEEDEDEDMDEEDDLGEIDPSAIISTRRTRGVRVDYTSPAALAKAGLKPEAADEEEGEDSFVAKDDEMHDD